MSDPSAAQGQEPESAEPQEGAPPNGQEPEANPEPEGSDPNVNWEDEARKARREAAERRTHARKLEKQLEDIQSKLQEREDADKSEAEKAAERTSQAEQKAAEAEARAKRAVLEAAVTGRAAKLEIVDPEAALQLMDESGIEFDDDGKPDGQTVDAALEALIADKPYLKAAQAAGAGWTPNPGKNDGTTPTETDAQRRARLMGGGPMPEWAHPEGARSRGGGVADLGAKTS